MTFYEKYELLCEEQGIKPQNTEILEILGVTSPTISGWKKGSMPKAEVLIKLCNHFHVSSDYMLGLSELRNPGTKLSEEESLLLDAYHTASVSGRFNIITVCMNEKKEKEVAVS